MKNADSKDLNALNYAIWDEIEVKKTFNKEIKRRKPININ